MDRGSAIARRLQYAELTLALEFRRRISEGRRIKKLSLYCQPRAKYITCAVGSYIYYIHGEREESVFEADCSITALWILYDDYTAPTYAIAGRFSHSCPATYAGDCIPDAPLNPDGLQPSYASSNVVWHQSSIPLAGSPAPGVVKQSFIALSPFLCHRLHPCPHVLYLPFHHGLLLTLRVLPCSHRRAVLVVDP